MNLPARNEKWWPRIVANSTLGDREWRDVWSPDIRRCVYSGSFSCGGALTARRKLPSNRLISGRRAKSKPLPGWAFASMNGNKTIQGETTA
jgi:hypothetical protein